MLIGLRVDVGRHGRRTSAISLAIPQELESCLDMRIAGIQLGCTLVCIQRVIDLVVATLILYMTLLANLHQTPYLGTWRRTYQSTEVVPNL